MSLPTNGTSGGGGMRGRESIYLGETDCKWLFQVVTVTKTLGPWRRSDFLCCTACLVVLCAFKEVPIYILLGILKRRKCIRCLQCFCLPKIEMDK